MKVSINGHPLSDAQKAVLRRGYCVIDMRPGPWSCSGLTYAEWSRLCDAGFIRHEKSRIHPDSSPDIAWERYRATKLGKAAAV